MRTYIIAAIFLTLICPRIARGKQAKSPPPSRGQNAAVIKVVPGRGKQIRIVVGTQRALVDLKDEVSGCLALFDSYPPRRIVKQPLGVKVVDRVRKDDKYYLILLTQAQSNCNIQGQCGAASDFTLIWLKLDASLKLEEKKSAVVEDCRSNIFVIVPEGESPIREPEDGPKIKLNGGKLAIDYGNSFDDDVRTISALSYDRKFPERGLVITTKEKKSQK
jgi:hypothetical protein